MSSFSANPAVLPQLRPWMVTQAVESLLPVDNNAQLHCSCGVVDPASLAAVAANFFGQGADEDCDLGSVSNLVFRRLFGHCFGGLPAPGGSSLFCFGYHPSTQKPRARGPRFYAALWVTVSLQILFGNCTEKISPDPPQMQSFGTWEPAPLARLRPV